MADAVADEPVASYCPVEEIPGEHCVYMRVHSNDWFGGAFTVGCFKDTPKSGDGTSTDWQQYRSAAETRADGAQQPKNYGVVKMIASKIRAVESQVLKHDPLKDNRAHTLIKGPKTAGNPKHRVMLRRLMEPCIDLNAPVTVAWFHSKEDQGG